MCMQVVLEPLEGDNDGIFLLTLQRPEARNAIGRRLLRELRQCLAQVAGESTTRCVVVRSAVPGIFCAGADLKVGRGRSATVHPAPAPAGATVPAPPALPPLPCLLRSGRVCRRARRQRLYGS